MPEHQNGRSNFSIFDIMNPLSSFKKFITGKALAATDDIFEKTRIEIAYGFSFSLTVLGILHTINLIANDLTILAFINIFPLTFLILSLVILKLSNSVRYTGYIYLFLQCTMSTLNIILQNLQPNIMATFWYMTLILYVFFVLGTRWGIAITLFTGSLIFIGLLNPGPEYPILYVDIPKELVIPEAPFFVFVPFSLMIYGMYLIVNTRKKAEEQLQTQKTMLEKSNQELESKNKDITDSINYAQKIQYAVLPQEEHIYRNIPLSFIYYKPRDIVSGDFFWFHEIDRDNYIIACADCTGHGVPGAMMTVIGSSLLNQIVIENKFSSPSAILTELDNLINSTLKQEKTRVQTVQDGMDIALLKVDKANKHLTFSSAKRPAIFFRNNQMQELKGSKYSLGGLRTGEKEFEEIKMNFQEEDMIYFYTDGVTDLFGGPKGKKFSSKRFKETLHSIHQLSMPEQKTKLDSIISGWKGDLEQVDDILVMGIRF